MIHDLVGWCRYAVFRSPIFHSAPTGSSAPPAPQLCSSSSAPSLAVAQPHRAGPRGAWGKRGLGLMAKQLGEGQESKHIGLLSLLPVYLCHFQGWRSLLFLHPL